MDEIILASNRLAPHIDEESTTKMCPSVSPVTLRSETSLRKTSEILAAHACIDNMEHK